MSYRALAGAAALLAAPLTIIAGVVAMPTLSDEPADQVAALEQHRDAMLAGMTLQLLTIALFIGGALWLATAVSGHAGRLAYAGGLLAVGGGLIVLFVDSIHAAAASAALGVGTGQATQVVGRILTSRVVSIAEPLQVLQDVGFVVLSIAVAKAGTPRWAAVAIAVGAVGEGAGFAVGSRGLVAAAFAIMLVGLLPTVRALVGGRVVRAAPMEPSAA